MPQPGNPIAWNRFAYVYNNPVNNVDPSGHFVVAAIDTIWDTVDLYNDARDCLGDSDSMACYMAAAGVGFIIIGSLEGPSNNTGRRALVSYDEAWAIRNTPRSDFYVRPNGDVIPATGYRYIDSDSWDLDTMKITNRIPAREKPKVLYIGFTKFETAPHARHGMQLDKVNWSNARFRAKFDTLQVVDDLRIPRGKGNRADWLEPITKDYPEHGLGGFPQAITNRSIYIDQLTLLPEVPVAIVPYQGPFLPTVYGK